jgi:glutaredoxin
VTGPGEGEAVLYARVGCPPCFALKRLAARSARRHGVRLRVITVDSDTDLVARYGDQVPVLLLPDGGRVQGGAGAREVEEAFHRTAPRRGPSWVRSVLGLAPRGRTGGASTT